ncbi:hypothetical protein HOLleu_41288 [Holothuria leucospilota]|uniref:Uncharacterized protein n=1 Tax=Holothuria leucospilota TaxID=206669 RepID=A0A9Q0YDS2_HOLLE|nr:hypothetical protein HOLleu_41288 [Holothuria leucospilota]
MGGHLFLSSFVFCDLITSSSLDINATDTFCPIKNTVYCLQCYHCDDSLNNACNFSKLVQCPDDMDVCSLEATWFGYLYTEMTMVKSCKPSNLCPNGVTHNKTSSCVRTHNGLSCTMCCDTNGCNNGANGGIPRPPPKPPVPQTLINRLIGSCPNRGKECETVLTWSGKFDVDSRLQVARRCDVEEEYLDKIHPHQYREGIECNGEDGQDFCVTCCTGDQCYSQAICSKSNYFLLVVLVIFVSFVNHWRIQ